MGKSPAFMKLYGLLKRTENKVKYVVLIIAAVFLTVPVCINSYTDGINKSLAGSLIRLHVIANSDSPEDQALKRDVRDTVLSYIKDEIGNSSDIEKTRSIIQHNLDKITNIALATVSGYGGTYGVKTSLGSYPFPTKSYGDVTLPAGNYQALRVVIGNGKGANWWCVLFPPLCFVDVTHGTIPDSVKSGLREALTEEEYKMITSSVNESDIPIKIKFKIVEMFQSSKAKLAGTIDRLFKEQG